MSRIGLIHHPLFTLGINLESLDLRRGFIKASLRYKNYGYTGNLYIWPFQGAYGLSKRYSHVPSGCRRTMSPNLPLVLIVLPFLPMKSNV